MSEVPLVRCSAVPLSVDDKNRASPKRHAGFASGELVRDLQVPLCNYLARMVGSDELGRDLAQETLIRAWTSLPELRADQLCWLLGTSVQKIGHLRSS